MAIPEPHYKSPMGFMMAKGDRDFVSLVSDFLQLKTVDPTIDALYEMCWGGLIDPSTRPDAQPARSLSESLAG